jgi:ABC-type antimicrobial peptide transport system permease subunit
MMPGALSVVSGILGFIAGLIATIIYFLILYAIGEMVYLLLTIEENTRQTAQAMLRQARSTTQAYQTTPSPGE